jgi:hypothetical protein
MTEKPAYSTIECRKCGQPMDWHSAQKVNGIAVTVFRCERCDQLTARTESKNDEAALVDTVA